MEKNDVVRQKLKSLRKGSKITQEQMAKYLKVDQSMVAKLENGTRKLSVELIEKLCNLYGCSEEYLFGQEEGFVPLDFAFRANNIEVEDLESIAMMNKIAANIRFMSRIVEENEDEKRD
ncbi:helix-turn-helix domain-containing protein [Tannockella kyphosi]|uniref:helix-turn-helix domain-containing protein n=1 Tax=Tannockella kyphosi TaxID=2899121 RepID=UPI002013606F|nr:helix-turn-helix transcriptional regulator [Tannockella kyphosi]